jgi:hypothetical protein
MAPKSQLAPPSPTGAKLFAPKCIALSTDPARMAQSRGLSPRAKKLTNWL